MARPTASLIAFGVLYLVLVQMVGVLIESIYILGLLKTALDANALAVLFLFAPVLLFVFPDRTAHWLVWLLYGVLLVSRGLVPYLPTSGRLVASGLAAGAALLLLPLLAVSRDEHEGRTAAAGGSAPALALAVCLSILVRTANHSLDLSLTPAGGWLGWILGLALGGALVRLTWGTEPAQDQSADDLRGRSRGRSAGYAVGYSAACAKARIGASIVGMYLVLILVYFAFSAPAVIARWTEANYTAVVLGVCSLAAAWAFVLVRVPGRLARISRPTLVVWNLTFTGSLVGTILAARVAFARSPDSPAVVVAGAAWWQHVLLAALLATFPVIFLDFQAFSTRLRAADPRPRDFAAGMLVGGGVLVGLVFVNICSNVWGYIRPLSPLFRNQFYLPYALAAGGLTLAVWRHKSAPPAFASGVAAAPAMAWAAILAALCIATAAFAVRTERAPSVAGQPESLVVMTYNIQQANDARGERACDRQLALVRRISPDVLALQESDSARVSLNNNDYVRYYAARLGYHSYYGPTPVTGTFGTAILSKYPLQNTRAVFTFSDRDEIGTAEAEITVAGRTFAIHNVHPAGSRSAMRAFAQRLVERSQAEPHTIILGDHNATDRDPAYRLLADVYTNAWSSAYPSQIGSGGTNTSGRNRIDHIFVSRNLGVRHPVYVPPPLSASDHPAHWATITWSNRWAAPRKMGKSWKGLE